MMDSQFIVVFNGVITRFHFIQNIFDSEEDSVVRLADENEIKQYLEIQSR